MLTLSRRYETSAQPLETARALLADPTPRDAAFMTLVAAALCAVGATALAVAVIVGPLIGPPDVVRPAKVSTLTP